MIKAYGFSLKGQRHETNQDNYLIKIENSKALFAVADGMGGHSGGEIASRVAIDTIAKDVVDYSEKSILKAVENANAQVFNKGMETQSLTGMGTTIALVALNDFDAIIVHVGDSRIYSILNNEAICLTKDHSLVQEMVEKGEITEEEALVHLQKNIITQALGVQTAVIPDVRKHKLSENEFLLICSDGLSNEVTNLDIVGIFNNNSQKSIAKLLCEKAYKNGSNDDITAIVIKILKD